MKKPILDSHIIVLKDAKQRLGRMIFDCNWYQQKCKETEEKIIALKEVITELESPKT